MLILPFHSRRSPAQRATNQRRKVPFLIFTAQNMYDGRKGDLARLVSRRTCTSGPTTRTLYMYIVLQKAFDLFDLKGNEFLTCRRRPKAT